MTNLLKPLPPPATHAPRPDKAVAKQPDTEQFVLLQRSNPAVFFLFAMRRSVACANREAVFMFSENVHVQD